MLPDLADSIVKLPDDAFARDIPQITLAISWVDIFNPAIYRLIREQLLEGIVSIWSIALNHVPGFRLDFQIYPPIWMFIQLIHQVLSHIKWIMPPNTSVLSIGKIGSLRKQLPCRSQQENQREIHNPIPHRIKLIFAFKLNTRYIPQRPAICLMPLFRCAPRICRLWLLVFYVNTRLSPKGNLRRVNHHGFQEDKPT